MSQIWARLRMLCCSGLNPMSLAPDAFKLTRELIPNAASALFLTTHEGDQISTYHDDCPASIHALCLEAGKLLSGPGEWNLRRQFSMPGVPKAGFMLEPPAEYFRGKAYNLLLRGCGHEHTLDVTLEVDGLRHGQLCFFREPGLSFNTRNVDDARRIGLYFEHALRAHRSEECDRLCATDQEAMIVATAEGGLLFASPAAQGLLEQIPLLGPAWPDRRRLPPVCQKLIAVLRDDHAHPWRLPAHSLPVIGGVLELRAHWLTPAGLPTRLPPLEQAELSMEQGLACITLTRYTPMALRIWRNLNRFKLSPRQMEVAYWMAMGGGREAARSRMAISESVLRDCVKQIYEQLDCSSQAELTDKLRAPSLQ